ncbi:MAG: hypothetical protein AB1736_02380 [Chloroflexota bacterium]
MTATARDLGVGKMPSLPPPSHEGFVLIVHEGDTEREVVIDAEGHGCRALPIPEDAQRACQLATYVDPVDLAGQAAGRLNIEDTTAFLALLWVAGIEGNAAPCRLAGLREGRLEQCIEASQARPYTVEFPGVALEVVGRSR